MNREKSSAATFMLLAAALILLLAVLLALWQIDMGQAHWIQTGEVRLNATGPVEEKPLVLMLDWRTVPGMASEEDVPRLAQCQLRLMPNTEYTLVVRTMHPLISAQVGGEEIYTGSQPYPLIGHKLRVRTGESGEFDLLLRLDDESGMSPPVVLLGRQDVMERHQILRIAIFCMLATIILTGGFVMLVNFLMQERKNENLAIWMLYMLLLLAQMDLILPQSGFAYVLREATMLLTCACLCSYASLCLGRKSDTPVLMGVLFATATVAVIFIVGYLATGRQIAIELGLPVQGVCLLLTGYFTISGLLRENAWRDTTKVLYAMIILMLLVGFVADMYLTRPHTMIIVPIMIYGSVMAGVHLWLLARLQADSREKSEHLEAELERRVTDRTEQLRLANKQLGRIDALRGEFFSHIAHDLQSPLTIIRGSLDLVLDETPVTPEERENYLRMARANAEKMTNRIKALRGLALLEETPFSPRVQAIRPVMEQCISNFAGMYRGSDIAFRTQGEDMDATFDISWLQNAMERLVSNAVRYTPGGGTITLGWEKASFGVNVYVADTGCGIASEDLQGLFQRFYKGWNSRDGFGIGLAVVQRVAQRHGGRAWAESEPGKGSSFYMYFPDLAAEAWVPNPEEE